MKHVYSYMMLCVVGHCKALQAQAQQGGQEQEGRQRTTRARGEPQEEAKDGAEQGQPGQEEGGQGVSS